MSFSDMRYLVADEADTLFDTGFGPELRQLILSVKVGQAFQHVCVTSMEYQNGGGSGEGAPDDRAMARPSCPPSWWR